MNKNSLILIGTVVYIMAQSQSTVAATETNSKAWRTTTELVPGQASWFDITSPKLPQSQEFYGKLFDWKFKPLKGTDMAVEIVSGEKSIGTLRICEGTISKANGIVYITVNDIQESSKKAKEAGGSIPDGFPFNLPDGSGAISMVVDPVGHPIGMYSQKMMPAEKPAAK
jgi:predicted enzyme related to lactoylglutathione lyase